MTTTPEGRREPLSAEERDDLRVLALRATQGPWKADGTIYEHMVAEIRSIMPGEERGIAQVWQHQQGFTDARFIAAANPATVLSLLAALEEAEGRLDEHALFDAETDLAFKDLDAQIATLTARAEASERREAWLREALRLAEPLVETLHSTSAHPEVRGSIWGKLKTIRAALTTKSGEASNAS